MKMHEGTGMGEVSGNTFGISAQKPPEQSVMNVNFETVKPTI
jgi:hypothetical protein